MAAVVGLGAAVVVEVGGTVDAEVLGAKVVDDEVLVRGGIVVEGCLVGCRATAHSGSATLVTVLGRGRGFERPGTVAVLRQPVSPGSF